MGPVGPGRVDPNPYEMKELKCWGPLDSGKPGTPPKNNCSQHASDTLPATLSRNAPQLLQNWWAAFGRPLLFLDFGDFLWGVRERVWRIWEACWWVPRFPRI